MKFLILLIGCCVSAYGQGNNKLNLAQEQLINETITSLSESDLLVFINHYKNDSTIGVVLEQLPLQMPLEKGRIQSEYGMRFHPIKLRYAMHSGIDIAAKIGSEIYASGSGVVSKVGYNSSNGNYVVINHGFGFESFYCHLESIVVEYGEEISRDTVIGTVGSTGHSTGPHLHYAIKRNNRYIDPLRFLKGL